MTDAVPWCSSRIRTLKLVSSTSAISGCCSVIAARRARSSALTGPLPSAVLVYRSSPTQSLIVASVSTRPSARFSVMTRKLSSRNSDS